MESSTDPILAAWRLLGDWGFTLVIFGVIGEVLAATTEFISEKYFKKVFKKWKRRLRLIEILSGAVLILGLAMEFKGHKRETQILDFSNAKLNDRASSNELARMELEKQIAETKTNVTKIDPRKQPIFSITAYVKLLVRPLEPIDSNGLASFPWPSPFKIKIPKDNGNGKQVELALGEFRNMQRGGRAAQINSDIRLRELKTGLGLENIENQFKSDSIDIIGRTRP